MSNNKQQTAVEIFWNQLPEILPFTVDTATAVKLDEAYQQAKEIEKEQIIEAFDQGVIAEFTHQVTGAPDTSGEQYFNQTYGDGVQ